MSASLIYDLVPIGSTVAWSDNTPQPPDRHRKKLSAWKTRNSQGRLIRKEGPRHSGNYTTPASVTVHEGDLGGNGVILVRMFRTFGLDADLTFTVVERPVAGSVRVFDRPGERAELVHLAPSRFEAEAWLKRHGHPHAVLYEVTADEIAADDIEGRAAA